MIRSIKFTRAIPTLMVVCLTCFAVNAVAPPEPPVAGPATNIKNDSFTANWKAVAGATSYRLDVSLDANFKTFIPGYSSINVVSTSLLVAGLSCNTYYYRVRSIDANAVSANSMAVAVKVCEK